MSSPDDVSCDPPALPYDELAEYAPFTVRLVRDDAGWMASYAHPEEVAEVVSERFADSVMWTEREAISWCEAWLRADDDFVRCSDWASDDSTGGRWATFAAHPRREMVSLANRLDHLTAELDELRARRDALLRTARERGWS